MDKQTETKKENEMTTYTKLQNGNWGLRIQGSAQAGQMIAVVKKSGESKKEQVGKIVWTGNGVTLATIAAASRQSYSSRREAREDQECELCGKNKYTCGHCIGW